MEGIVATLRNECLGYKLEPTCNNNCLITKNDEMLEFCKLDLGGRPETGLALVRHSSPDPSQLDQVPQYQPRKLVQEICPLEIGMPYY